MDPLCTLYPHPPSSGWYLLFMHVSISTGTVSPSRQYQLSSSCHHPPTCKSPCCQLEVLEPSRLSSESQQQAHGLFFLPWGPRTWEARPDMYLSVVTGFSTISQMYPPQDMRLQNRPLNYSKRQPGEYGHQRRRKAGPARQQAWTERGREGRREGDVGRWRPAHHSRGQHTPPTSSWSSLSSAWEEPLARGGG